MNSERNDERQWCSYCGGEFSENPHRCPPVGPPEPEQTDIHGAGCNCPRNTGDHCYGKTFHIATPPEPERERITATAIRGLVDGKVNVWNFALPASHHFVAEQMDKAGVTGGLKMEQGFCTNRGRFVDRKEAMQIALAAGQVEQGKTYQASDLFSEDFKPSTESRTLAELKLVREAIREGRTMSDDQAKRGIDLFALTCTATEHTVDDECGCEEAWTERSCDDEACHITIGGRDEGMWSGGEMNHEETAGWVAQLNAAHEEVCEWRAKLDALIQGLELNNIENLRQESVEIVRGLGQHIAAISKGVNEERDDLRAKVEKYEEMDRWRQEAYRSLECPLCGAPSCAHRERWDFAALHEIAIRRGKRIAELETQLAKARQAMSECHNCGHGTPHNYDPGDSYPHTCCGPECPCASIEKRAAQKGYRDGAEEALRRVRGELQDRYVWTSESMKKALRDAIERVRKEMGLEEEK